MLITTSLFYHLFLGLKHKKITCLMYSNAEFNLQMQQNSD